MGHEIFLKLLMGHKELSYPFISYVYINFLEKKEFVSLTTADMKIGKRQFFSCHCNGCNKKKKLYQKPESYRCKLPLKKFIWMNQGNVK